MVAEALLLLVKMLPCGLLLEHPAHLEGHGAVQARLLEVVLLAG